MSLTLTLVKSFNRLTQHRFIYLSQLRKYKLKTIKDED
jgi:hypothetical protein